LAPRGAKYQTLAKTLHNHVSINSEKKEGGLVDLKELVYGLSGILMEQNFNPHKKILCRCEKVYKRQHVITADLTPVKKFF
jgi:hypothetical protein